MIGTSLKSTPEKLADGIVDNLKVIRLVHKLLNSVVENDFKGYEEDKNLPKNLSD